MLNGPDDPLNEDFGRPTKTTARSLLEKAYLQWSKVRQLICLTL